MSTREIIAAASGGSSAASTDDYFKNVVLLLNGDGTNGSQNNTFLDSSPNNFTITTNGTVGQGSFSPYGNNWSGNFSGNITNAIGIANNSAYDLGSGNFTLELFFNSLILNGDILGVSNGYAAGTTSYRVSIASSAPTFSWWIGPSSSEQIITSSATYLKGEWNHLAIVRNGSTITMYLNGSQVASSSISGTIYFDSSCIMELGVDANSTSNLFTGYLSNFRIVNSAIYSGSTITVPTEKLTAVSGTQLLFLQDNRLVDNSSNNLSYFFISSGNGPAIVKYGPFNLTAAYSPSVDGGSFQSVSSGYLTGNSSTNATNFGTGDFTISFWMYQTTSSGVQSIIKGIGNQDYCGFVTNSTNNITFVDENNITVITGDQLKSYKWYYVCLVRSSGTTKLYLNGVQTGSDYTDSTNYAGQSTYPIIGGDGGGASYRGYLSDVRFVKSALSPSIPTAPLTAISNTTYLLNFTNAGIIDRSCQSCYRTLGDIQISTSVKKYGTGSIYVDGVSEYLQENLASSLWPITLLSANFTIECWLYLVDLNRAQAIVGRGTSTTGWAVSINSSNQVVFTNGTTATTSTGTLSANTWYHIAVVRNGSSIKIYIDGTNDGSLTASPTYNQGNYLNIGASRSASDVLNGYLDDLRITRGIARYTTNFTPPTAALPTY